jgi:hypothetical protein
VPGVCSEDRAAEESVAEGSGATSLVVGAETTGLVLSEAEDEDRVLDRVSLFVTVTVMVVFVDTVVCNLVSEDVEDVLS